VAAARSLLVAGLDDRVREPSALLWGVDLFEEGSERVSPPVGIVVFD
jgi:hypothetical protein